MKPGSLEEQDYEYCLTAQAFANEKHRFDKMVIVGHWPSSNYRDKWIEKSKDGILVKRDGIVGNYFGNYEFV